MIPRENHTLTKCVLLKNWTYKPLPFISVLYLPKPLFISYFWCIVIPSCFSLFSLFVYQTTLYDSIIFFYFNNDFPISLEPGLLMPISGMSDITSFWCDLKLYMLQLNIPPFTISVRALWFSYFPLCHLFKKKNQKKTNKHYYPFHTIIILGPLQAFFPLKLILKTSINFID